MELDAVLLWIGLFYIIRAGYDTSFYETQT